MPMSAVITPGEWKSAKAGGAFARARGQLAAVLAPGAGAAPERLSRMILIRGAGGGAAQNNASAGNAPAIQGGRANR